MSADQQSSSDAAAGQPPGRPPADPEAMRRAMAEYVTEVHAAYLRRAENLSPAERGRLPLLSGGPITVAAVGARDLHVLATRESLGPLRDPEVEISGELPGLTWTLRFYDPVVLPSLGLVEQSGQPAREEIRRALGLATVLYHLVAPPGSGLTPHHASHVGTALANSHVTAVRDLQWLRRQFPGAQPVVNELERALTVGLPRAAALLAQQLAPGDERIEELGPEPDSDALRRALMAAVGDPTGADTREAG